jgi:uncharacterized RDD family membrane protein YckC
MQREGFGIRLLAALIDAAILIVVFLLIGLLAGGSMIAVMSGGGGGTTAQGGATAVGIGFVILAIVIAIGYTLTEIFMAGTPGKQILGIIIADERGVRASTQQLATRWVVKHSGDLIRMVGTLTGIAIIVSLGGLVGLVIVVGCFFVLGQKRQAFHDNAAKTAVFKKALITSGAQGFPVMPPGSQAPPPPPPAAPPAV